MKFNANGRLQPRNQEVAKINKPLSKKFDLDTVLEVLEALVSKKIDIDPGSYSKSVQILDFSPRVGMALFQGRS